MNKNQARKILGLDGTEDEKTVKKKYGKLMLEQKKAQVKMVVSDNSLKSKTRKKYVDLDLWIRLIDTVKLAKDKGLEAAGIAMVAEKIMKSGNKLAGII